MALLDERAALLDERVALVDERVALVNERVPLVDERVALLNERVALVNERVALLNERVALSLFKYAMRWYNLVHYCRCQEQSNTLMGNDGAQLAQLGRISSIHSESSSHFNCNSMSSTTVCQCKSGCKSTKNW